MTEVFYGLQHTVIYGQIHELCKHLCFHYRDGHFQHLIEFSTQLSGRWNAVLRDTNVVVTF